MEFDVFRLRFELYYLSFNIFKLFGKIDPEVSRMNGKKLL